MFVGSSKTSSCGGGSDGGRLDGDRKGLSLGAPYFGGFSLLYDRGNTSDLILASNDDLGSPPSSYGAVARELAADVDLHGRVRELEREQRENETE